MGRPAAFMIQSVVLDAWAVVAWLRDERPAAEELEVQLHGRPLMNWVNVCEVAYRMRRERGAVAAHELVEGIVARCMVVEADRHHSLMAASVKADFRLSLADAYAAATALVAEVPLATGDPELLVEERRWQIVDLRQ